MEKMDGKIILNPSPLALNPESTLFSFFAPEILKCGLGISLEDTNENVKN